MRRNLTHASRCVSATRHECYRHTQCVSWNQCYTGGRNLFSQDDRVTVIVVQTFPTNVRSSQLPGELQGADDRNDWASIFDKASVLCGSIKLPYCDKIRKTFGPAATGFEERPSLSCGVWVFHFDTDGKVNNCELVY